MPVLLAPSGKLVVRSLPSRFFRARFPFFQRQPASVTRAFQLPAASWHVGEMKY
jgi:hypothetical protein